MPLLGVQSSRVFYHCQITGEFLPVCCCERADPPATPSPEPPCCTCEEEQQASRDEGLAEQDCDCCEIHYEQGRSEIHARAGSDTVVFEYSTHSPVLIRQLDMPPAITSPTRKPSWSEPPRHPLYILFESFRS